MASDVESDMWILELEDIEAGGRLLKRTRVGSRQAIGEKTTFNRGQVLYSKLRPYLKKVLQADEDGICTPELIAFDVYAGINPRYIMYYLICNFVDKVINQRSYGVKMPRVDAQFMVNLPVPLPTIAVQNKIVDIIDEVFSAVETINKLQVQYSSDLEVLKSKIIDAGVQGKLTEQLPEDGTAEELLEQIAKEKKQLIKEKKIKATKALPEITEDEILFEIPSNWKWVCLNNTGILQTGATPPKTNPDYFGNDIPFLSPGDIQDNTIVSYNNQGLSNLGIEKARVVDENSVLQVCIGGSIGKAAINDRKVTFNQQINSVTPILCEAKYLFYCMVSSHFMGKIQIASAGAATPIINKSKWGELLIPLPPLAEQKRIVEKITQIFEQI